MTAAELQVEHSVELEILMNGKKTTLLTAVEHVIGQTILLTPIQIGGKVVGFPPNCAVHFLYVGENQVFCWKNVKIVFLLLMLHLPIRLLLHMLLPS